MKCQLVFSKVKQTLYKTCIYDGGGGGHSVCVHVCVCVFIHIEASNIFLNCNGRQEGIMYVEVVMFQLTSTTLIREILILYIP